LFLLFSSLGYFGAPSLGATSDCSFVLGADPSFSDSPSHIPSSPSPSHIPSSPSPSHGPIAPISSWYLYLLLLGVSVWVIWDLYYLGQGGTFLFLFRYFNYYIFDRPTSWSLDLLAFRSLLDYCGVALLHPEQYMALKLGLPSSNLSVDLAPRLFKCGTIITQAANEFAPYLYGGEFSNLLTEELYSILDKWEKNIFYTFITQRFPGVPLPDYISPISRIYE
jgi:hypothetical protein